MNDDELRCLLRELRDEPVPPSSLARVRARVARGTLKSRYRWPWFAVAALAGLAAFGLLVDRRQPPPAAPIVVSEAPVPSPVPAPGLVRKVNHKKRMPMPGRVPPGIAAVIRMETPDPNVVLMLLSEGEED